MANKKLKSNDILNLSKQEFSYKTIIVKSNNGKEFELQIQEKLNETKIMELINDLKERSVYCRNNNIEFDEILTRITDDEAKIDEQFQTEQTKFAKKHGFMLIDNELQEEVDKL